MSPAVLHRAPVDAAKAQARPLSGVYEHCGDWASCQEPARANDDQRLTGSSCLWHSEHRQRCWCGSYPLTDLRVPRYSISEQIPMRGHTAISYYDWLIVHVFHLVLQRIMSGNSWRHSGGIPSENAANFNRDQVLEPGTSVRRPSLQTRCLRLMPLSVDAVLLGVPWRPSGGFSIDHVVIHHHHRYRIQHVAGAIVGTLGAGRMMREGTLIIPANKRSFASPEEPCRNSDAPPQAHPGRRHPWRCYSAASGLLPCLPHLQP